MKKRKIRIYFRESNIIFVDEISLMLIDGFGYTLEDFMASGLAYVTKRAV